MQKCLSLSLLLFCFILTACNQTVPKAALQLSGDSMSLRQMQTRSFATSNEKKILTSGAAVLQDLGFSIQESETKLGVILGEKDRDAMEAGQVVGQVMMAAILGVYVPVDKNQKIRASLITRPIAKNKTNLRITIQRIVWDERGNISKIESIQDEKIYQEFFSKLSKSIFLTANEI